MILLDTNVISALMRRESDEVVLGWLNAQAAPSLWTTTINEMEVRYGIESLATGRRRDELERAFDDFLTVVIKDRMVAFDTAAARKAAELMAERKRRGRPGELRDTMIAGIALATNATIATRNVAHFGDPGLKVVNPWGLL